jgi:hypothetical protein
MSVEQHRQWDDLAHAAGYLRAAVQRPPRRDDATAAEVAAWRSAAHAAEWSLVALMQLCDPDRAPAANQVEGGS